MLTAVSIALFVLLAGPAVRAPDGLEQLAMVRGWLGGPELAMTSQWAPLWPLLLVPFAWLGLEQGAWVLNLLLAGAVAWPLHLLVETVSGRRAARVAVAVWVLMPTVLNHAVVIDARPLLWLLVTLVPALAVSGRWKAAFGVAVLAPLARPEGAVALPLLAVGWLLSGGDWKKAAGGLVLGVLPTAAVRALRGGRGAWEAFYSPWSSTWPTDDFIALTGAASGPTAYREFLLTGVGAGIETPPSDPMALLERLPRGLTLVGEGLVESLGVVLLLAALVGLVRVALGGWRPALLAAMVFAPMLALAPMPMLDGQGTLATNLLFLAPVLLAAAVHGSFWLAGKRGRLWPLAAALLVGGTLESRFGPLRCPDPVYLEDSQSADAMTAWLQHNAPADGQVACTITGRGVVFRAGLSPIALPSTWEGWDPPAGSGVLLTAVDLLGQDGGRGLELLESADWELMWVVSDADLVAWYGGSTGSDTWLAYLRKRATSQ
jgi:hypothetical protein